MVVSAPWLRIDPAEQQRRERKDAYARELQAQIQQTQARRARDRMEREERDRREEVENQQYVACANLRGGGGAPIKGVAGDIVADLHLLKEGEGGSKAPSFHQPAPQSQQRYQVATPSSYPPLRGGGGDPPGRQQGRGGLAGLLDDRTQLEREAREQARRRHMLELEQQIAERKAAKEREKEERAALDRKFEEQMREAQPAAPPPPSLPPIATQNHSTQLSARAAYSDVREKKDQRAFSLADDIANLKAGLFGRVISPTTVSLDLAQSEQQRNPRPLVVGYSRDDELARFLEWERARSREREREREIERDALIARQREFERMVEQQRSDHERQRREDDERRLQMEQRMRDQLDVMRRDFVSQQLQLMSQIEQQMARMRASAAAPPPALPPQWVMQQASAASAVMPHSAALNRASQRPSAHYQYMEGLPLPYGGGFHPLGHSMYSGYQSADANDDHSPVSRKGRAFSDEREVEMEASLEDLLRDFLDKDPLNGV